MAICSWARLYTLFFSPSLAFLVRKTLRDLRKGLDPFWGHDTGRSACKLDHHNLNNSIERVKNLQSSSYKVLYRGLKKKESHQLQWEGRGANERASSSLNAPLFGIRWNGESARSLTFGFPLLERKKVRRKRDIPPVPPFFHVRPPSQHTHTHRDRQKERLT